MLECHRRAQDPNAIFRDASLSHQVSPMTGAGGVCVAIGELADGLEIDLNKVPLETPRFEWYRN